MSKVATNSPTDLDAALEFVIRRIREEADRSGHPLDEDEEDFLRNLPTKPTNPTLHSAHYAGEGVLGTFPIRDIPFERLCNLARQAYKSDTTIGTESERQWNFAAAVLRLNGHPMSWLLQWAGIKLRKAAGSADGCLLLTTAILLIVVSAFVLIPLLHFGSGLAEAWKIIVWILSGFFCAGLLVALYFWTRRLEVWEGKKTVEKYRCDLSRSVSKSVNA